VAELPSGTVTILFTDIEGSTRLWRRGTWPSGRGAVGIRPELRRRHSL